MRNPTAPRERGSLRALLLVLVLATGACEEENTLDPSLIDVTELQDIFTFEVHGLDQVTDAERYLWVMTGDQATVEVTSGLTGGSAFLQIRGGNGEVVYGEDIQAEVDGVTEVNTSGIWQIDVVFEKASGEFGFALERDTIP
ncbi:MAG: hypothetical protein AB7T31_02890 [Gemmatimonadales bacterium]